MIYLKNKIASWLRSHSKVRKFVRHVKMVIIRKWYHLENVHSTFYLGGKADIASDFKAGPHSYVGRGCGICPRVSIGAYTLIAHEVSILGGDHRYDLPGTPICYSGRPELPYTMIGEDVWVGHRALIKAGVKIGRGAVVGAGAVVTKDVPPYTIIAGVPAKMIRSRFNNSEERERHDAMLDSALLEGSLPPQRVLGVSGN